MKNILSSDEINTAINILNKFQRSHQALNVPTCSFKNLLETLSVLEQSFILKLCDLDTTIADLAESVRDEFVIPADDNYSKNFVRLHPAVYESFQKLNTTLYQQTAGRLYIISGYRSPAYQVLIFLRELYYANFDIAQAQRVAKLPSKSEHGHYPSHAIDVDIEKSHTIKKISTSFEKTDAYFWMITHAKKYGFSLSYPENNQKDTIFEPWHWLYATGD